MQRRFGQSRAHPFGEAEGVCHIGPRQNNGKLLATDAAYRIDLAQFMQQHLRKIPEDLVAHGVAVAVVDIFEEVEVEHQHGGQRGRVALHALQFLLHARHEVAPVRQPCEEVGGSGVLQLSLQLLVLRDIRDEAVPHGAAIIKPAGPRFRFSPALAHVRQQHPELDMPSLQRCG